MAVEIKMSKEELSRGNEQTRQLLEIQKENQRWLYYLLIGSFGLIVFLNYMFPDVYWVEKKPMYDAKNGLIGLVLTFFGCAFLLNAMFFRSIGKETFGYYLLTWFIGVILCLVLLYYGLPLFLGF